MSTVHGVFELPDRQVACRVRTPCLLSEAAGEAGVVLNVACGGKGVCGGCAVDLLEGHFQTAKGSAQELAAGKARRVLSCQTRLLDGQPFRVRVPRHSLVEAGEQIVMDFAHTPAVTLRPPVRKERLHLPAPSLRDQRGDMERISDELHKRGYEGPIIASVYVARSVELEKSRYDVTVTVTGDQGAWHVIRVQPGQGTPGLYGAAVDVGTTTVVVALVDLTAGKIIDAASSYNQQIIRCDDVASRISYACDDDKLRELRDLVVESTVNRLLGLLVGRHGLEEADVAHMTVAGNTVMTHLFCGLSPAGLGGVPFPPISNFPGPYRAGQLHLAMNPEGFVDIFPSSAAYIGGDITADMYVCGLQKRQAVTVMIDIGTNAEIIVGNQDRSIGCAAPAGPAYEGHGLSCGMRAATGAIESFELDDYLAQPRFSVIGDARPAGVCGSGLIDLLAAAWRAGLITSAGRFSPEAVEKCPRISKVRQHDKEHLAYELVPAERTDDGLSPIIITERDIAALLQAKGVIFAALQMAMKHFGNGFAGIERFYLAGGFARHINLDNAVSIGLLPDIDRARYTFIGNGSLGGAFLALVDEQVRRQLPHLAAAPTVIELNLDPEFMDAYCLAMFIPHADPALFPSISRRS